MRLRGNLYMLAGNDKRYTKEEELEFGRVIQEGLKAQELLDSDASADLTKEEKLELEKKSHEAELARYELFEANISFANHLANKYLRTTQTRYSLSDLAQDAYAALYDSTRTYDPKKNCVLRTHAYYRIAKALSVTVNKMRTVRLPENKMGDYLEITRAEKAYSDMHNGVINLQDQRDYVVKVTGISSDMVSLIKGTLLGAISLNAPLGEDGGEFGDLIEDSDANSHLIQNEILSELIGELSQYERDLIAFEMAVGRSSMTLEEFMSAHSLTPEAVSKEAKRVVRAMKKRATARTSGGI